MCRKSLWCGHTLQILYQQNYPRNLNRNTLNEYAQITWHFKSISNQVKSDLKERRFRKGQKQFERPHYRIWVIILSLMSTSAFSHTSHIRRTRVDIGPGRWNVSSAHETSCSIGKRWGHAWPKRHLSNNKLPKSCRFSLCVLGKYV